MESLRFTAQTLLVLTALTSVPADWRHGYELAKATRLKSGTLYPILIRLADRGLLEACWEAEQPVGRPRRHMYRLTADGLAAATTALEMAALAAKTTPRAPKPGQATAARRRPITAEGA